LCGLEDFGSLHHFDRVIGPVLYFSRPVFGKQLIFCRFFSDLLFCNLNIRKTITENNNNSTIPEMK
jgi:hypothetical protein